MLGRAVRMGENSLERPPGWGWGLQIPEGWGRLDGWRRVAGERPRHQRPCDGCKNGPNAAHVPTAHSLQNVVLPQGVSVPRKWLARGLCCSTLEK